MRLKIISTNNTENEISDIRKKIGLMQPPEMNPKYRLGKVLDTELTEEIKTALKYLLAKDLHCRIPLYVLFSDKIKVESSQHYHVWREGNYLWKQKLKSKLKDTDLLYVIDETFKTYRRIIEKLNLTQRKSQGEDDSTLWNKERIIFALDEQLIISKKGNCDIIEEYLEDMIDDDFKKRLDPKNFIAVKGKKIVNLITGEVRNRTIQDFCSREVSVEYNINAKSEILDKVISEICVFDKEIITFIERILGYSLTGTCSEGKIFIFQGESLAGKSIIINLLQDTLGPGYSTFLNKNVIMNKKKEENGTDPFVHQLVGKRVGIINQTDESDIINPGKTKVIATNEPLVYRLLHSNNIQTLSASYTLILATNNRPKMIETDESIWRRLMLIPFLAKFVEFPSNDREFKVDKNLRERLKDTNIKEAFLTKLIRAAIQYNSEGLGKIPEKVSRALEKYRKETDIIAQFVKEFLITTDNKKDAIGATALWKMFKDQYKNNMSQKEFGSKIKAFLGDSVKNSVGFKEYRNVKINVSHF